MTPPSTPCSADPEPWFSDDPEERAEAVAACGYCPLLGPCRELALPRELALRPSNRHGVWAGVDFEQPRQENRAAQARDRREEAAARITENPSPPDPPAPDLPSDERATS